MWNIHPGAEVFESLFRGASGAGNASLNAQAMHHILTCCQICRENLRKSGWTAERMSRLVDLSAIRFYRERETTLHGPSYDAAFSGAEKALEALFAPEAPFESSLELAFKELDRTSAEEQARIFTETVHLAHPEVVRELIERSHALRYDDPNKMLHYARLAHLAADGCSPHKSGSPQRLADLQARGWLQYANSLRVCGRLHEADEALATAQRRQTSGTRDPLLRALILEQSASLRTFQGRFEEAISLSKEAGAVYQELDQRHAIGRTMVQIATAFFYAGDPEPAVRTLNRAIPLIDPHEDSRLLLAACHNLILCYIDVGKPEQALSLYFEVRELYREFDGHTTILLRTAWQEGRLLRDLGYLQAAEMTLRRVRQGFLQRNLAYEVALVSLDLATVYVRLGKVEEVRQLTTEAIPIFRALRVEREVLGSLLQLQQAAGQEQQALELIRVLNAQLAPLAQRNNSH